MLELLQRCDARRKILILDCCFSGAFARGAKGDDNLNLGEKVQGRGLYVLTASRASEYSFEGEPLPGALQPEGSVFTNALLKGIRTGRADSNNDGYITVEDAYNFAFSELSGGPSPQTPQRWSYGSEGEFVLALNPLAALHHHSIRDNIAPLLTSDHSVLRRGGVRLLEDLASSDSSEDAAWAFNALEALLDDVDREIASAAEVALERLRREEIELEGIEVELLAAVEPAALDVVRSILTGPGESGALEPSHTEAGPTPDNGEAPVQQSNTKDADARGLRRPDSPLLSAPNARNRRIVALVRRAVGLAITLTVLVL